MKLYQIILVVTGLSVCSTASAQDSASVLFIGNSYTYANDLPTMLVNIAASFGDVVTKDSQTPGGATFQVHTNNQATFDKIGLQDWDFVVLQGQSQEPSFADAQVNTQTIPYAKQLADSVYANNFCSEVLMYMTWGRENGDPQWAPISTFDGMNARLRAAYMRIADTVQGSVAPVGVAWKYVRDSYPTIDLYVSDGSHPSVEGTYLAACVFYSSIFRKSSVGSTFISSIDPTTATLLQGAADLAVMDSLEQWNLRPISAHTQAQFLASNPVAAFEFIFTNTSTKANQFFWDFGDGNSSTLENPVHTYAAMGTYQVTLVAVSPCDSDTTTQYITAPLVGLNEFSIEGLQMKHLEPGVYEMRLPDWCLNVELCSVEGKMIQVDPTDSAQLRLNFKDAGDGIYLLKLSGMSETRTIRLPY